MILAVVFFSNLGLSIPYLIYPSLFLNPAHTILSGEYSEAYRGLLLGITLASYSFGQFFGTPVIASLSDQYGRRKVLSITLWLIAICSLLVVAAIETKTLWLLICAQFFGGFLESNYVIAQSMVAGMKGLNKYDSFGKIDASFNLAYVLGPIVGGVLSNSAIHQSFSLTTPFYVMSALCLTLACLAYLALTIHPPRHQAIAQPLRYPINVFKRIPLFFQNPKLRLLLIVATLQALAVEIFFQFGPIYLTAKWLLEPGQLMLYMIALSLALSFGYGWLIGRVSVRFPNRKILFWAIGSFTLILAGVVFTQGPIIMLLLFTLGGLGIAVSTTNLNVQVSNSASDDFQGEVLGIQSSLRVFGNGAICILGGVLFSVSAPIILLLGAGISLLSLMYYLVKVNQLEPEKPLQSPLIS